MGLKKKCMALALTFLSCTQNEALPNDLNIACYNCNEELVVKLISQGAEINSSDKHGLTPLSTALLRGNARIANILLDKGARLDIKDDLGADSMYYCLPDTIEKMYKLGGNLNSIRAADGNSLLQKTILADDSKSIEFMLRHYSDIDLKHKNNKGESAIDTAEKCQSKFLPQLMSMHKDQTSK
jgi:ankyrin repeat protein